MYSVFTFTDIYRIVIKTYETRRKLHGKRGLYQMAILLQVQVRRAFEIFFWVHKFTQIFRQSWDQTNHFADKDEKTTLNAQNLVKNILVERQI